MNLAMIGNLIATVFTAIAVWLSMQWKPYPHTDNEQLIALVLSYLAGLLTALASQLTVHIKKEPDSRIYGEGNHD
jgi:NADH:ubiquinone oxidoreductase subunit 2 (subunit N)